MGFESAQPRKKSIDEILAELNAAAEPNSLERTIDGVLCQIFPTSENTWTVYQDGVPYAVTKRSDGTLEASMQGALDLAPATIEAGKARAILAVTATLA